jgi:hypothetical protein
VAHLPRRDKEVWVDLYCLSNEQLVEDASSGGLVAATTHNKFIIKNKFNKYCFFLLLNFVGHKVTLCIIS